MFNRKLNRFLIVDTGCQKRLIKYIYKMLFLCHNVSYIIVCIPFRQVNVMQPKVKVFMRVLLATDDVATAQQLTRALTSAAILSDHTNFGTEALEMVCRYDHDAVLITMKLSDISGLDVVRRMRDVRLHTPVLMLSAENSPQLRVKAYNVGADDVIIMPADHEELVARLQAVVRRTRGYSDPSIRIGNLVVNPQSREVSAHGKAIHLTAKEFAILELLVMRKGIAVNKDAFLNQLYGGMDEPDAKIIDVFVCKLRKKLETAGAGKLIITVWGRGYLLREPDMTLSV